MLTSGRMTRYNGCCSKEGRQKMAEVTPQIQSPEPLAMMQMLNSS